MGLLAMAPPVGIQIPAE